MGKQMRFENSKPTIIAVRAGVRMARISKNPAPGASPHRFNRTNAFRMNTFSPAQHGFNKLVLEVYRTGGSEALNKIKNFYEHFREQDRDNHLKHQCLLLAGDVLERQGDFTSASTMYRDILLEKSSSDDAYLLVVQKAAAVLQKLDKRHEAVLLIERVLHQPQRNPLQVLYLMALYTGMADPQAEMPAVFGPLFGWVCTGLDVQPASPDLKTAIPALAAGAREEGKALSLLFATAGEVSKAENVQRLNTFIDQARVKPFREEARRYLASLQAR
jgi:tetratricopeptide (TPR) repeat protein